jgi:tetratricopeptide (TPR) repeat protein
LRLILRGIDAMSDFDALVVAMRGLDNELRLRKPTPIPLEKLTLTRTQGFVLSRIDGHSHFRDIISTLPPEEESAASRFVFGLLMLGVVEFWPSLAEGPFRVANILRDHADRCALEQMQQKTISEAYSRMRKQNPHEILGVTPSASRTAIERAYAEAKALFARDRLLASVRDRFRSELSVIESRLVEAYLHLTQPKRKETRPRPGAATPETHNVNAEDLLMRPELDKTRSRTEADEAARVGGLYYAKARQAMISGDFHNAIQYGKLAVSYCTEDARFYSLLADCQVRNPSARWQRMAEQNYSKATELDPWNVQYWINLGRFYKRRGLHLRARRQFEEALRLAPEHEEATQELAALR